MCRDKRWAPSHADVTGSVNGDGTLTLQKVAEHGTDVRFHPATPADLQWFYPNATGTWQYREPAALADGWRVGTLSSAGMQLAPIAGLVDGIVAARKPTLRSPYIQSVAVARHGKLASSQSPNARAYHGCQAPWHPSRGGWHRRCGVNLHDPSPRRTEHLSRHASSLRRIEHLSRHASLAPNTCRIAIVTSVRCCMVTSCGN
jgi:hypothetical protein